MEKLADILYLIFTIHNVLSAEYIEVCELTMTMTKFNTSIKRKRKLGVDQMNNQYVIEC